MMTGKEEKSFFHGMDMTPFQAVLDLARTRPLLKAAIDFAAFHHDGVFRKSGEPFITHPLAVSGILIRDFGLQDPEILAAAVLHDVVEDVQAVDLSQIREKFGDLVAAYVNGCTKLKSFKVNRLESVDRTHRKLLKTASQRPGILLIKLADRLHNMSTLGAMPENKRRQKAMETMEVYVPLAAKFSLFTVKRKLQHYALEQLFPKKSKKLKKKMADLAGAGWLRELREMLEKAYRTYPCPVQVRYRVKTLRAFYSVHRKTLGEEHLENPVDFTVVLDTAERQACYQALGLINTLFEPIPKSIRDFIANPKTNGYQSLHVRVLAHDTKLLFKIRTRAMDRAASQGLLLFQDDREKYLAYRYRVKEILEGIGEYSGTPADRKMLIRHLPEEGEVFVYTPGNEIHYLPKGSTVLDFAYKVHTRLGEKCSHGVIARKQVPISYPLKDGEIVRIVTRSKPLDVHAGLEKMCRTVKARTGINSLLQQKRRACAARVGKELMHQVLARYNLGVDILRSDAVRDFLAYKHWEPEELYIKVGQDILSPRELIWEIRGLHLDQDSSCGRDTVTGRTRITVSRLQGGVHKFSKCCHPLPGLAPVVAALSERGISFHRADCQILARDRDVTQDKIHQVVWDFERPWPEPLRFSVQVRHATLLACAKVLSGMEKALDIVHISGQTQPHRSRVRMDLNLGSFGRARDFFAPFEHQGMVIQVENFFPADSLHSFWQSGDESSINEPLS